MFRRQARHERLVRPVEIAYISLNEAGLLVEAVAATRAMGWDPLVFLDSRTERSERAILKRAGIIATVLNNNHGFVEGLYGAIAEHIEADWVWILTADEVPSVGLMAAATQAVEEAGPAITSIGFARKWVFRDDVGEFWVSRAEFIGSDPQWRIIRHREVEFSPIIHTPGYLIPQGSAAGIPAENAAYHLDWVAHSRELRERKLAYYEKLLPGANETFLHWYLPERNPLEHHFEPLADPDVLEFARACFRLQADVGWTDKLGDNK